MKITVFGGAKPQPGEPEYENAVLLGKLLGEQGHSVLTGGYSGTMEAVSSGAASSGAHVIGVSCQEIENWRHSPVNPWVAEEWKAPNLHERIIRIIDGCDAAIALPGGAGTLAEISMMWNRLMIAAIPPKPLILIGEGWKQTFEVLFAQQNGHIKPEEQCWLAFAGNVQEAVELLPKS